MGAPTRRHPSRHTCPVRCPFPPSHWGPHYANISRVEPTTPLLTPSIPGGCAWRLAYEKPIATLQKMPLRKDMKTSVSLVAISTHFERHPICRTCSYLVLVVLLGLCVFEVRAAQQIFSSRDLWLPLGCGFASPDDTAVPFTVPGCCTLYVRRLQLTSFGQHNPPPPIGGTTLANYFNCLLMMDLSTDGVNWFPSQGNGPTATLLDHTNDSGNSRLFSLELLQMSISADTVFGTVMIRESPTLQSLGQTIITTTNGGYLSSSSVTTWLEASMDGGATWLAGSLPADLDLFRPLPVLSISNLDSGSVQICWTTQPYVQYQLQRADYVDSTNWISIGPLLTGTVSNVCAPDSILGQTQRFYRVQLSP